MFLKNFELKYLGYPVDNKISCNTEPCVPHFEFINTWIDETYTGKCNNSQLQVACNCIEYPGFYCRKFKTNKLKLNGYKKAFINWSMPDDAAVIYINGVERLLLYWFPSNPQEIEELCRYSTAYFFIDEIAINLKEKITQCNGLTSYLSYAKYIKNACDKSHMVDVSKFLNFDGNDEIYAYDLNNCGGPGALSLIMDFEIN